MNDRPPTSDPDPRLVSTSLGDIAVAEEGPSEAVPVLCVHGLPGTSRDFRYLGPLLAHRFHVLRVEMPGFGRSPLHGVESLAGWAQALEALRDALDLDRPLLLAHSFGGGSCILAAGAAPHRWRGLALVASLGLRVHRAMHFSPVAYRWMAAGLHLPGVRTVFLKAASGTYRRVGLPTPVDWRELLFHVRLLASVDFKALTAAARAAELPALAVSALDDPVTQQSVQRNLAATLPHALPVVFESGGHHLQKHRAPEVAAAVVERFAG